MIDEFSATLTTTDGITLEAGVRMPPAPRGGMVVCHPHPLYGGDMDNPVVVRIVEVCSDLGLATIRFNFRGVGRSAGTHGNGITERHDVEAARAHLAPLLGGRPLLLAGYSFGAAVVAQVAPGRADLAGVVLVAPPLARLDPAGFAGLERFGEQAVIIAGSSDEICPSDGLARLQETLPRASVHVVDGANHFFFGKLYPLGEAVATWVRARLLA